MSEKNSADLGLGEPITRRDFISGVAALGVAPAALANAGSTAASPLPAVIRSPGYPPAATGLRGQYPGSFEMAHAARDGQVPDLPVGEVDAARDDLIVVGGGISGLAAAYFFRKALGEGRRVLILDNHDDFGGHAKRNEFHHEGRMYLGYGGTMSIETPTIPWATRTCRMRSARM